MIIMTIHIWLYSCEYICVHRDNGHMYTHSQLRFLRIYVYLQVFTVPTYYCDIYIWHILYTCIACISLLLACLLPTSGFKARSVRHNFPLRAWPAGLAVAPISYPTKIKKKRTCNPTQKQWGLGPEGHESSLGLGTAKQNKNTSSRQEMHTLAFHTWIFIPKCEEQRHPPICSNSNTDSNTIKTIMQWPLRIQSQARPEAGATWPGQLQFFKGVISLQKQARKNKRP